MKHILSSILLSSLLFLTPSVSNAQIQPCSNYECMMQAAKTAFNSGDFVNAFKNFRAAKAYDASKTVEVDTWIEKTFNEINKQKEDMKKAKDLAEEKTKEAKNSLKIAHAEKLAADSARVQAEKDN